MKEDYLHLLWKLKRLPSNHLQLTDKRKLEIVDFGWYNTASGPDFFNGKIKIDGIIWSGNIEMHIKSSDWYAHKHQNDAAYTNVILHVVHEHNQEVVVNEEKLPTLELKQFIDLNHYQKYENLHLSNTWIPCDKQIKTISSLTYVQQMETAIINRLERKSKLLEQELKLLKGDNLQLIYELYAKTFGLKVNEMPFLELCKKLPFRYIQNKSETEILVLLLGVSGFLNSEENEFTDLKSEWNFNKIKYNLSEMNFYSWKKKGLRPASFPKNKIAAFAKFCSLPKNFDLENSDLVFQNSFYLSGNFCNLLVINVQSLFLWHLGKKNNLLQLQEKALNLLENLKPEQNNITKQWSKLGFKANNAFETQAFIEQKNENCVNKKCLQCKIGIALLSN